MTENRTLAQETISKIGESIKLQGWVATKRDHGKLTFIDLRDRSGVVQCVGYQKMGELTTESVIELVGTVKKRPAGLVNSKLETGGVEVDVQEYTILNPAKELPIQVEGDGYDIGEEVRLKYRYLDLRRARLHNTLKLRSQCIEALRTALFAQEFFEVETPMLTKSTKEGARDFLVPSRFQPGKCYALPQSPQQYKQLLMTAGVERYFQVARCIRDEDLRADRGFEFTQLDLEMSFASQSEVMALVERVVKAAVVAVGGKIKQDPFPVINYPDAIAKYGADKFDLRSEEERKQEKQVGSPVLAFAWVVKFPFFKKVDKADLAEVRDGKSGWTFTHNPFSAPIPEHEAWHLAGEHIGEIETAQYDLVCNGFEVGGGSIRAHRPDLLRATFKIMGYSDAEIAASIGHMLEAFEVGTPPHGGIALGIDRLVMLLAGESNLKEVIAFPMSSSGRTAVMDAPSQVSEEQWEELGLKVANEKQVGPYDKLLSLLKSHGVKYQHFEHEPVFTSEQAAALRGTDMHQGAKALVLQVDNKDYVIFVLPADLRADLEKLKTLLGAKKVAMASRESVKARTGIEVGAIPPFGSIFGMKTYMDARLGENETIAFNAARHDRSIEMPYADFVAVEKPIVVE